MLNDSVFVSLFSILGLHSHFLYANSEETGNCQGMVVLFSMTHIFFYMSYLINRVLEIDRYTHTHINLLKPKSEI